MPVANRPEVLAHSLRRLSQAKNVPDVNIFVDHVGQERLDQVEYVRDTYYPTAFLFYAKEHTLCTSGTWNILNSIKSGYETGAEFIILVEEDVMMYPDFMARHAAQLASDEFAASCGRIVPNLYAKHGPIYTNPGSCLTKRLIKALVPHLNEDYYSATAPYIHKTFGREPFNSSLDDGLIRMVCWQNDWACAHAMPPICAHQGFDWYNEIDIYSNNEGSLEERIARFEKITASIKPGDRYAKDFEPFLPTTNP